MDTGTHVGRLRMRGAERDVPALRLAVSSQVGGADIHPRGVPPASVLVVQHFPDPLPGRLGPGRGVPWPDPEWEQAARERLAALYRRAVRPRRGRVPFGAEAVLFVDEAETLACLALDLARGGRGERWCWRAVLRETQAADLPSLLIARARSLPALFTLLARWDEAVSVAGALGAPDVRRVVGEMVRVHGLSSELLPPEPGRGDENGSPSSPAPWGRRLPASPVLSKAQEHLLGLALVLHESSARARSWRFVAEVRRWWRSSSQGTSSEKPSLGRAGSKPSPSGEGLGEVAGGGNPSVERPTHPRGLAPPRPHPPAPSPEGEEEPERAHRGIVEEVAKASPPRLGETTQNGPSPASVEEIGAPLESILQEVALQPWVFPEGGLATRLGGVLYLIHLIESLGLLDRFAEEEPELAERVGAWGFLEMLGRALLGSQGEDYADDPLWPALAELDGRAPADRLDPDLSPWLGSVLPEVRGRLAEALEVEPEEAAEALLLCPGRLYVTSSHVDLVAGLDRISLPVRRAGLDRNPGWLPRFGRVVLFHFE